MFVDPVVDGIRQNGARVAEECGGDIHRMADRFRREQASSAERIIRRCPGKTPPHKPRPEE